jgi:hypothetical protein
MFHRVFDTYYFILFIFAYSYHFHAIKVPKNNFSSNYTLFTLRRSSLVAKWRQMYQKLQNPPFLHTKT